MPQGAPPELRACQPFATTPESSRAGTGHSCEDGAPLTCAVRTNLLWRDTRGSAEDNRIWAPNLTPRLDAECGR